MAEAQSPEVYQPEALTTRAAAFWADGRPRIGMHTSIAGDLNRALDIARNIGCTALQIFSGSPRMWPRAEHRSIAPERAARFRNRRAELRMGPLAIHANYLINLASDNDRLWARSVGAFRDELTRGTALAAEYLIVHPGSGRGGSLRQAVERIAAGLASAARGFAPGVPRILVENTAGQGSAVGARLEELREILDCCAERQVWPPPGVCLDTAHLFAAGYAIHTPEGLQRTLDEVDSIFGAHGGLDAVAVIHVNDSKAPFGSRVDRHEHIGRGHIGLEAFGRILNHPRLRRGERAFLLETPVEPPGADRRNVRRLWLLMDPANLPPRLRERCRAKGKTARRAKHSATRAFPKRKGQTK